MTTTINETSTLDDLVSFLQSAEPLRRRSAQRAPRPAAAPRPAVTPIQAATRRKPPRSAAKYYARERAARKSHDYRSAHDAESHGRRLNQIECRLVAWLVCRSLGPDWSFEPNHEQNNWHHLRHVPTGAAYSFGISWRDNSRYQISIDEVYSRDDNNTITVSAERSPADIARDIERRLAHVFDAKQKLSAATSKRRRDEVAAKLAILATAKAYGSDLKRSNNWSRQNGPEGSSVDFDGGVHIDGDNKQGASISCQWGYYGVELNICTHNVEMAVRIAEFVRQQYSK